MCFVNSLLVLDFLLYMGTLIISFKYYFLNNFHMFCEFLIVLDFLLYMGTLIISLSSEEKIQQRK